MTEQFEQAKKKFVSKYVNNDNEPTFLPDLTALLEQHKEMLCKNCKYRGLPDSIQEALNSGDGVYRP